MPALSPAALKQHLLDLRQHSPRADHVVRAYGHYGEVRGNQLAGAVTYFGFLSFFPLLAVSFAVLGWVVEVDPGAREQVQKFLTDNLPGLVGADKGIDISTIEGAKAGVGLIGLLGLLYAGLGWLDALREALRAMYELPPGGGNAVVRKLTDIGVLGALGLGVLVTLSISTLATSVTTQALGLVGLADSTLAVLALKVLAVALSLAADTLLVALIFARLPGHRLPWGNVVSGAFLGAILLEVLKLLGTWLIGRTTQNPVYGTFAVVVGLLVWMNFLSRALLLASAWSVTGARPVTAPAATKEPLVDIPVLEVRSLTGRRRRQGRARLAAGAGIVALVAARRRPARAGAGSILSRTPDPGS